VELEAAQRRRWGLPELAPPKDAELGKEPWHFELRHFIQKSPHRHPIVTQTGHIVGETEVVSITERPMMNTITTLLTDDAQEHFPYDLSAWMDRQQLMCLALQAAAEVGSAHFGAGDFIMEGERHRPQVLLALLSYSYATGRFASSLIEQGIREDEKMRYLGANSQPYSQLLRRFRRRHRPALKECLLDLFRTVWKSRHHLLSEPAWANAAPTDVQGLVPWNGRFMRDLVCEVERRIDQAVQFDTLEMDE
jgi:hypothetical protein